MTARAFPAAACLLAEEATPDALAATIALMVEAQVDPIVAVVRAGVAVPAPARAVVPTARRADESTGLRFGLTQLANVPGVGALLVTVTHEPPVLVVVLAVLDRARRGEPLVATEDPTGPVWAHRDAFRELMTMPGGLAAVLAARPVARVAGTKRND